MFKLDYLKKKYPVTSETFINAGYFANYEIDLAENKK